ncbi:hypothetical protein [Duganella sp. BuS-21]|uniref:hypothetical protein n=1 Tax=Duganella sp. BuS-21 TaxID=2943848 RepID=UPI0035A5D0D9
MHEFVAGRDGDPAARLRPSTRIGERHLLSCFIAEGQAHVSAMPLPAVAKRAEA